MIQLFILIDLGKCGINRLDLIITSFCIQIDYFDETS